MTRQAAERRRRRAAAADPQRARRAVKNVGLLLIAGDRGLAGSFNSQIIRAGVRHREEILEERARTSRSTPSAAASTSSLNFRNMAPKSAYTGFTDRPAFSDARNIADELMADYIDGNIDSGRDRSTTATSRR